MLRQLYTAVCLCAEKWWRICAWRVEELHRCGGAGGVFGVSGGSEPSVGEVQGAGQWDHYTHRVKEKRGEGLAHGGAGGEEIARRGECGEQEK